MSGIKYSLCCWLILYVEGVASSCANCLALKFAEIFCTEIYKYSFIKIREIFARDFLLLLYLFPWNLMRSFEIVEILRCLVKTSVYMSFFEIIALLAENYLFNEIIFWELWRNCQDLKILGRGICVGKKSIPCYLLMLLQVEKPGIVSIPLWKRSMSDPVWRLQ